MKKTISFIMVLLCIICLSSCGKIVSGSLEKESNNNTTPSQQVSKDEEASKEAKKTYIFLKEHLDKETIILGPTTALIFKQNNLYRFQIVLKYKQDKRLKDTLMELNYLYKTNSKTYLEIDNNPLKI